MLTARSADELAAVAAELPGESLVVPADITDAAAVDEVFAAAEARWGAVEILVANAGAAASAPLAMTTDEMWDAQIALNLTAPFRCVRRAVPSMKAAGFGRIVVIASTAAKEGAPYIAAYTAAKHGVLGLVRSAAAELAGKGITVNAICPGYVDTPMTDTSVDRIVGLTGMDADAARARLAAMQPIGRLITPEEVADAVGWVIGADAVTGQGINVDGGGLQS